MLGFRVVNLMLPEASQTGVIRTQAGEWQINRHPDYKKTLEAIQRGKCGETYFIEYDGPNESQAFDELTPILLAASYATGLSVTIVNSTPNSECMILQPSEHWPRERAMGAGSPIVLTDDNFFDLVNLFCIAWPLAGATEKARLLVHHWLDGLACWSMEDLYLSATTLLQIVAATEESLSGQSLSYLNGVSSAAKRAGIRALSDDFKNMRNELIHSGQLIGSRFKGPDKLACANVIADTLNWFDEYVHSVLALGKTRKVRFKGGDFIGLNAYSID